MLDSDGGVLDSDGGGVLDSDGGGGGGARHCATVCEGGVLDSM